MSDGQATEFGGKLQKNGVWPKPYEPIAREQMSLTYRTGDPTGETIPAKKDEGVYFSGLLPFDEQYEKREAEGAFEAGEYDPMNDL